jgi:hypothetical protein
MGNGNETYGNGRSITRAENRRRVKAWTAAHPEQAKANGLKYRRSAKGRATHTKTRRAWRKLNTASERVRHAKYVSNLPDAYLRKLLKERGILHPSREHIVMQRRRIQILRARRVLNLIAYGSRIKN